MSCITHGCWADAGVVSFWEPLPPVVSLTLVTLNWGYAKWIFWFCLPLVNKEKKSIEHEHELMLSCSIKGLVFILPEEASYCCWWSEFTSSGSMLSLKGADAPFHQYKSELKRVHSPQLGLSEPFRRHFRPKLIWNKVTDECNSCWITAVILATQNIVCMKPIPTELIYTLYLKRLLPRNLPHSARSSNIIVNNLRPTLKPGSHIKIF